MKKFLLALTALFAVSALTACSSDDEFLTDDELSSLTPMADPKFTVMLRIYSSNIPFFEELSSYTKSYAHAFHSQEELRQANIRYSWIDYKNGEYNPSFEEKSETLASRYSNIDWNKQTLVIIGQWFPSQTPNIFLNYGNIYSKKGKFYIDVNIDYYGPGMNLALCKCGIAFIINSPNVPVKNIIVKASGTVPEYDPESDEFFKAPFKRTYTY